MTGGKYPASAGALCHEMHHLHNTNGVYGEVAKSLHHPRLWCWAECNVGPAGGETFDWVGVECFLRDIIHLILDLESLGTWLVIFLPESACMTENHDCRFASIDSFVPVSDRFGWGEHQLLCRTWASLAA